MVSLYFADLLSKTPSLLHRIADEFTSVEIVLFVFMAIELLITFAFFPLVNYTTIVLNLAATSAIILLLNWGNATIDKRWMHGLHAFYVVPIVLYLFKTTEMISFPIHGHDFDPVLISIDHSLFGTNPTMWLFTHIPVVPLFVEFLQICYFSYYFLPIIVAVELFNRKHSLDATSEHRQYEFEPLEELRFTIVYGFLLSYICYMLLPGVGPRFTIHTFESLDTDLPGVWLTDGIRWLIDHGENIRRGMTNAEAMRYVTRDVFPSGHTEMTLISILLAFRFRVRWRWVVLILGSGLIFSTVYLRYHYVIDVIAGSLLAVIALYTAEPVMRVLKRIRILPAKM